MANNINGHTSCNATDGRLTLQSRRCASLVLQGVCSWPLNLLRLCM